MIQLILSKPEKIESSFVRLVKASKKNIVAVLVTRPYSSFEPVFKNACNKKECFFIDTLSESEYEKTVYINPENLTSLSIAINQAQQALGGKVAIVFDSLNNLVLRNSSSTLSKFFAFILNKSEDWKAEVIILASQNAKTQEIIDIIKQRANKVTRR